MLYCKKPVYFNKTTTDRRINNGSGRGNSTSKANDAKDLSIDERISKFGHQLKNEFVCRISLRYFMDLGKTNFLLKIDLRIKCYLETDMKNICLTNKKNTTWTIWLKNICSTNNLLLWACNGCGTAPLNNHINNPVYQELIEEDECDSAKSNKMV